MVIPTTSPYPPYVPPHACPGRKVTCPDCGEEFYQPRWTGPIWVVPTTWTYPIVCSQTYTSVSNGT